MKDLEQTLYDTDFSKDTDLKSRLAARLFGSASSSKVRAIRAVTNAVLNGDLDFKEMRQLSDQEIIKKLTSLHGIGNWTAKMFLIFVLDRPDVLPVEDGAFLQTYRWLYKTTDCSKNSVHKRCRKWKPYSSVASRFFYRALDMGLTREDFHLFRGDP